MNSAARLPPVPHRVYAAVIDGSNPASWPPYGPGRPELYKIIAPLKRYEAVSPDQSLGPASIDFILADSAAIQADDTTSIVAVLVDGTEFSGDDLCVPFRQRLKQLEQLCFTLAKQKDARWRSLGFRVWIVGRPEQQLHKTNVPWEIKQKVKFALESTVPDKTVRVIVQIVPNEAVIEFVAQDTVQDVADRIPFLVFEGGR